MRHVVCALSGRATRRRLFIYGSSMWNGARLAPPRTRPTSGSTAAEGFSRLMRAQQIKYLDAICCEKALEWVSLPCPAKHLGDLKSSLIDPRDIVAAKKACGKRLFLALRAQPRG